MKRKKGEKKLVVSLEKGSCMHISGQTHIRSFAVSTRSDDSLSKFEKTHSRCCSVVRECDFVLLLCVTRVRKRYRECV